MSRSAIALLLILGSAATAQAREVPPSSVGVMGMAMQIDAIQSGSTSDQLIGPGVEATIPASDNFALTLRYYQLKGTSGSKASALGSSAVTLTGGSLGLLVGTNWRQGWNLFAGFSSYSEHVAGVVGTNSYNAGGIDGLLGLGYEGSTVVMNLTAGIRPTSDYEKTYFPTTGTKLRILTGTFDLGFRF